MNCRTWLTWSHLTRCFFWWWTCRNVLRSASEKHDTWRSFNDSWLRRLRTRRSSRNDTDLYYTCKKAYIGVGRTCRSTYQHACQIVYNSEGLVRNMAQIIHICHISALFFYHRSIEIQGRQLCNNPVQRCVPEGLGPRVSAQRSGSGGTWKALGVRSCRISARSWFSIDPISSMLSKLRREVELIQHVRHWLPLFRWMR